MAKVLKKKKGLSREELEALDNNELINKILQLEAHNFQLKQIIEKKSCAESSKNSNSSRNNFDFTNCRKRHILLKFYYLGWDYQGFATQEDTTNTIEHHIFNALIKSCLIESRETSNYHRCGRTDKGVSAYSQVISLDVRSSLTPEQAESKDSNFQEMDYCKILNKILPKNIRCLSWCPAEPEISARFDCKIRCYKYFFPRGNLNIAAMNTALKYIIGTHDFRNLCKMDVGNGVTNFIRNIMEAKVTCKNENSKGCNDSCNSDEISKYRNSGYDMCELTIKSNAFLWHQIRCIVGILFLIGQEQEKPEIVQELLDIEKCPRKPQYNLAHYIPLNLFHCEYDCKNWLNHTPTIIRVIKDLQEEWTYTTVKCTMIRSMLDDLETKFENIIDCDLKFQSNCLLQGVEPKVYKPLMQRETCESLEERIEHYKKKRRIEITDK